MFTFLRRLWDGVRRFNQTTTGKVVTFSIVAVLVGAGIWLYYFLFPPLPKSVRVYDVARLNTPCGFDPRQPERCWTNEERQWYYHTSQGSQIMPYDWFVALEQPDNDELFIASDHISQLRLLPDPNPLNNPDLLPVGFAKDDPDPVTGIQNVGLSCATCHTAQITYRGMGLRVEGAPGRFNFDMFLQRLILGVGVTVQPKFFARWFEREPTKFTRFARRVLKDRYSNQEAQKLKEDVRAWLKEKVVEQLQQFGSDNATHEKPTAGSFGRLDALGTGGNRVYRKLTPANLRVLNAPVTALPVWYASEYDWVQSNGSIRQPMARNIIEALAVNASIVLPGDPAKNDRFVSSVRMKNMFELETTISWMAPPAWPETIFGAIDRAKADAGRVLYQQHCSRCHSPQIEPAPLCDDPVAVRNKKRYYMLRLSSIDEIGTDPLDAANFTDRTVDASAIGLGANVSGAEVIKTVIGGVLRRGFKDLNLTQAQQDEWSGFRYDLWRAPKAYPARPLDGVWAAAPYLHNDSVPNLYELLLPADERSSSFYVGSVEFDPTRVGYETDRFTGGFKIDVTRPGNSNAGHEFRNAPAGTRGVLGPALTDDQRWQLIEYLKVINEFPEARKAAASQPDSAWSSTCWDPAKDPRRQ